MRNLILVIAVVAIGGCGKVEEDHDAAPADIDAAVDAAIDAVDAPPVTSCTPNQFVDCDNGNARICNATGDGVTVQSCGAPGCNATAGRCNDCVPSQVACDGNVVERCAADGTLLPDEACQLSCVAAPSAHCAHLSPVYLPAVCDAVAVQPALDITNSATIDTALDASCTGGVVAQSGGPPICVMRYGSITVQTGRTLTVIGGRAVALVADGPLQVLGTIDASASGATSGPGGGTRTSGTLSSSSTGGGGAGALTAGGAGGNLTVAGGAANGGAAFDPLDGTVLVGGARAASPNVGLGVNGGGGGGALTLISCRGTVTISGTIDLGGGGGRGGYDLTAGGQLNLRGGGGGGTGGYGVIQGLAVNVSGQLYANGGGGGGGGADDSIGPGQPGGDGTRSATVSASGGAPASTGGTGGTGGRAGANPGVGSAPSGQTSPGGGGGAAGRFQVYTPSGVTPALAPTAISPPFQPNLTVTTR